MTGRRKSRQCGSRSRWRTALCVEVQREDFDYEGLTPAECHRLVALRLAMVIPAQIPDFIIANMGGLNNARRHLLERTKDEELPWEIFDDIHADYERWKNSH